MDYKLKAFKREAREGSTYRFAVVDNSKSYPANFVCMLPRKLIHSKTNTYGGVFGEIFKDKSVDVALKLVNNALKTERDTEVKMELESRFRLIDPKQVGQVKCSKCFKMFKPETTKKYKRYICMKCQTSKKQNWHQNV